MNRSGINDISVKRVLWVEDNIGQMNSFFSAGVLKIEETDCVNTLHDAIYKIDDNPFKYDTILLDINFAGNVLSNENDSLANLRKDLEKRIYLPDKTEIVDKYKSTVAEENQELNDPDEIEMWYFEQKGGYFIYVYLLEKGYPSENISFLTANAPISNYNRKNNISIDFKTEAKEWINAYKTCDDINTLKRKMQRHLVNKGVNTIEKKAEINECIEYLAKKELNEPDEYIHQVLQKIYTSDKTNSENSNVHDTGDDIIKNFYNANLKKPRFIEKNIAEKDKLIKEEDQKWINERRSESNVARWLVLWSASMLEEKFQKQEETMNNNCVELLCDGASIRKYKDYYINNNTDLEEAIELMNEKSVQLRENIRQIYYTFCSSLGKEQEEMIYYAMLSALIPFDSGNKAGINEKFRQACVIFLRQARNFCAHNKMGTKLTAHTIIFIWIAYVSALLDRSQRNDFTTWYKKADEFFRKPINEDVTIRSFDDIKAKENIRKVIRYFQTNNSNEDYKYRELVKPDEQGDYKDYYEYFNDIDTYIYILGRTKKIGDSSISVQSRQNYFVFALASIVLGYYKFNLNNIGKEEKIFLDEAKRILTHYNVTELDKDIDWDNILKA